MKTLAFIMIISSLSAACSSDSPKSENDSMQDVSSRAAAVEYEKVLDKYSAGDTEYNGFYHSFGFHAAILNSDLLEANIRLQSRFYMWDKTHTEQERDKLFKSAAEGTSVFLSFFTPEKKNDNLSTEKSIWRVLLDVGGKRYVGKIKKLKNNLSEMIALYPFHTRWNTAYYVTFPVPTSQAETQTSKLTITGPMGSRNIDFPAKAP